MGFYLVESGLEGDGRGYEPSSRFATGARSNDALRRYPPLARLASNDRCPAPKCHPPSQSCPSGHAPHLPLPTSADGPGKAGSKSVEKVGGIADGQRTAGELLRAISPCLATRPNAPIPMSYRPRRPELRRSLSCSPGADQRESDCPGWSEQRHSSNPAQPRPVPCRTR